MHLAGRNSHFWMQWAFNTSDKINGHNIISVFWGRGWLNVSLLGAAKQKFAKKIRLVNLKMDGFLSDPVVAQFCNY